MKKPKNFGMGAIRVRAIRGPREGIQWYWRAERYEGGGSTTVWTGWATREELEKRLAALLEVWVGAQDLRTDLSKRTHAINHLSARHVIGEIGDVLLVRLGLEHLEQFRDARLRAGNATRTVELDVEILRRAWRWGVGRGLCENRRLPKPDIKIKSAREKHTPSREDFWKVVGEMSGWPKLCVLLLASTGARIGEIASLRWEDIDLDAGEVRVRGKTGYRDVIIPESMVEHLAAVRPDQRTGRVLSAGADTVRTSITQRYLKEACERAGVRYFTPHGIRRMVIDQYYDKGVDVGTVAAQLGQSPKVALKYYRQSTGQTKRRAVALAGIGEPVESNVVAFDKAKKEGGE